jgi:hypothetical protein
MNLGEANIVLRHRSGLEVVDLTLRFVRSLAPGQFLQLSGIILLPAWLSLVFLRQFYEPPWISIWLGALCTMRILEIPFTVLSGHLLFDRRVSLRLVLSESLSVLPKAAISMAAYGICMALSLLLVVGPLFVGASYFFLPEVLILEKAGAFGSFRRASVFLKGRSGTGVEGLMLRTSLLLSFVVLGETLGQALIEHGLSLQTETENLWTEGGSAFALAGLFLFIPYGAAHRFLCYINERTRQDGWDIQVAFLSLKKATLVPGMEVNDVA